MKQLIALLTSLFMCLFNNVEYTTTAMRDYTADNYYKVSESDPPDYRDIYNYSPTASSKENCKTTNYTSNGKIITYTDEEKTDSNLVEGYWFVDGKSAKTENLANSHDYTFQDDCYIIAPYDCKLQSYSATNSGHDMVLQFSVGSSSYQITFSKMERWYCCMKRVPDANGPILEYPWVHTSQEQYGKTFLAGDVLGKAFSGKTKVTVVKLTNTGTASTTFKDMYLNK